MSQQQAIVSSAQPDGMMETLAPLVLLWALPLYIAGGFLGLLQFKLVCTCPMLISLKGAHNGALHLVRDVVVPAKYVYSGSRTQVYGWVANAASWRSKLWVWQRLRPGAARVAGSREPR
jgi:hypothetical protein